MRFLLLSGLLALSACGVDGAPERPEPPPGVVVSGEAMIGGRADGI